MDTGYLVNRKQIAFETKKTFFMKKGDKAKVSPEITKENQWIVGEVIDIENNPSLNGGEFQFNNVIQPFQGCGK